MAGWDRRIMQPERPAERSPVAYPLRPISHLATEDAIRTTAGAAYKRSLWIIVNPWFAHFAHQEALLRLHRAIRHGSSAAATMEGLVIQARCRGPSVPTAARPSSLSRAMNPYTLIVIAQQTRYADAVDTEVPARSRNTKWGTPFLPMQGACTPASQMIHFFCK